MYSPLKCLAHDVNNKLTVLYSRLNKTEQLVVSEVPVDECLYQLDKIRQTLESISFLCRDVLYESSDKDLVDMENILRHLVTNYDKDLICISLDGPKTLMVKSRLGILQSIFENIIHNSIDQKSTHINIEFLSQGVLISDNGGGMEDGMIEQILSGRVMSSKGEHRGFGLSSLVEYCRQNSWKLEMKNKIHPQGYGLAIQIYFK